MLVLSRKKTQSIQIGEDVTVTIARIKGNRVSVAIAAPRDVQIVRTEIADNDQASGSDDKA